MKRTVFVLLLALASSACYQRHMILGDGRQWEAGTTRWDMTVGGDDRSFEVHVPPQRPRNRIGLPRPYPVVILLHGSGADGETIRRQSRFDSLADAEHVVVVYPDGVTALLGLGSDWNAGTCCGTAASDNVDDIGFIRALIAALSTHLPVDRRRIYVAGFSDGASMTYHVACAMSREVAAIGVVSGSIVDDHCHPTLAMPVIAFHGTADREVPYGSPSLTTPLDPASDVAALPPSVQFWAAEDGCKDLRTQQISAHVHREFFRSCAGAQTVLYTIDQGKHAWPGGAKDGSDGESPTTEVNASALMLQFFLQHER